MPASHATRCAISQRLLLAGDRASSSSLAGGRVVRMSVERQCQYRSGAGVGCVGVDVVSVSESCRWESQGHSQFQSGSSASGSHVSSHSCFSLHPPSPSTLPLNLSHASSLPSFCGPVALCMHLASSLASCLQSPCLQTVMHPSCQRHTCARLL